MNKIDTDKWGIIGHDNVVNYLGLSLTNHKFAHAYLLSGNRSIGKKTIAKRFIQTLLCEKYIEADVASEMPCGECQSCKHLKKKMHPDYYQLDLAEDKKNITIDQIREWQRKLQNKTFLTKYKVGVINGAEFLSMEAANAILKTIEEPTGNTIIILIVNDINLLLPTIVSRSQVLKCGLVSDEVIYGFLQKNSVGRRMARDIAKLSFGLPGKAINFMHNEESLQIDKAAILQVLNIAQKPIHERIGFLQKKFQKQDFIKSQKIANEIVSIFTLITRELLLYKEESENWYRLEFASDELKEFARNLSLIEIVNLTNKTLDWRTKLRQNINPQLFTEDLLLSF
jgi:DNA polymerase III subunit delta'